MGIPGYREVRGRAKHKDTQENRAKMFCLAGRPPACLSGSPNFSILYGAGKHDAPPCYGSRISLRASSGSCAYYRDRDIPRPRYSTIFRDGDIPRPRYSAMAICHDDDIPRRRCSRAFRDGDSHGYSAMAIVRHADILQIGVRRCRCL